MILVFAWKPRCATIISVNSSERSTFDISSEPDANVPRPSPATLMSAVPELMDSWKRLLADLVKPDELLNFAIASCPSLTISPFEYTPLISPNEPML